MKIEKPWEEYSEQEKTEAIREGWEEGKNKEAEAANSKRGIVDKILGRNKVTGMDLLHEEANSDNARFDDKKAREASDGSEGDEENMHLDLRKEQEKAGEESRVFQLEGKMMKKRAELLGSANEKATLVGFGLERDMVRKKLGESGLISKDASEKIREHIRLSGGQSENYSLDAFQETQKIEGISSDAIKLEKEAVILAGECEKGWLEPGEFLRGLEEGISTVGLKKTREKLGEEIEDQKDALERMSEQVLERKKKALEEMINLPDEELNFEQQQWRRRFNEQIASGKGMGQVVQAWFDHPEKSFSEGLSRVLEEFKLSGGRKITEEEQKKEMRKKIVLAKAEVLGIS